MDRSVGVWKSWWPEKGEANDRYPYGQIAATQSDHAEKTRRGSVRDGAGAIDAGSVCWGVLVISLHKHCAG